MHCSGQPRSLLAIPVSRSNGDLFQSRAVCLYKQRAPNFIFCTEHGWANASVTAKGGSRRF